MVCVDLHVCLWKGDRQESACKEKREREKENKREQFKILNLSQILLELIIVFEPTFPANLVRLQLPPQFTSSSMRNCVCEQKWV